MPKKIRDIEVAEISLVGKAANKKKFLFYKEDKSQAPDNTTTSGTFTVMDAVTIEKISSGVLEKLTKHFDASEIAEAEAAKQTAANQSAQLEKMAHTLELMQNCIEFVGTLDVEEHQKTKLASALTSVIDYWQIGAGQKEPNTEETK